MSHQDKSETRSNYWQQQITTWESSGQSQKMFCQSHHLNYHRFGYWRRKFLIQDGDDAQQTTAFVPVSYHQQPASTELSLSLPNGLVLQGIATDNLPVVYQLINRLS